jgi:hypothetical protein
MSGRSGLSANMQVGNIAKLVLDEGIAMRVKFDGPVPPQSDLYFRGPGSAPPSTAANGARSAAARGGAQLQVSGAPVHYSVTLEPNNRPLAAGAGRSRASP